MKNQGEQSNGRAALGVMPVVPGGGDSEHAGLVVPGEAAARLRPGERPRWPHVCIDLETLARMPSAVVLEIGAVAFDPLRGEEQDGPRGPVFSCEVAMRAPDQQDRDIDDETLIWWAERAKDGAMVPGLHYGSGLRDSMLALVEWVRHHCAPDVRVWSWGVDFDLGILADVGRDFGIDLPWQYGNQRCARTLCKVLDIEREGPVTHVAVEDAAQEAMAVVKALREAARI